MLHKSINGTNVHVIYAFSYADALTRLAATGLLVADVGKVARQLDNNSFWVLTNDAPVTWLELTSVAAPPASHGLTHASGGSDPVPIATQLVGGLLSAADKIRLDTLANGNISVSVRNATGALIPKGKLVTTVGYSVPESRYLVGLADRDDPTKLPCLAVTITDLPDSANADVLVFGFLTGIDTSAFATNDQLVLGTLGGYTLSPFDVPGLTGKLQNVGIVTRVGLLDGEILFQPDGVDGASMLQVYALLGTSGTPSSANRYVTNADPRNTDARTPTAHAALHLFGGGDTLALTDAEIAVGAAILEAKLALNFPTHTTANDPSVGEKAALAGTSGVPGGANRYVTDADPRNTNSRTPTAHAASHLPAGSDPLTTAAPSTIGTVNAAGAADSFVRSDHVHAHGDQTEATLHAVATTVANGFLSASDKTKLDGLSAFDIRDVLVFDHFMTGNAGDTDEFGQMGWRVDTNGTGAAVAFTGIQGHPGIAVLEGGTVAAGRSSIHLGDNTLGGNIIVDGGAQNTIELEALIKFTATIAAANLEIFQIGFGLEWNANGELLNGVYIRFNPTADSHFVMTTASASTRSTANGTTVVALNVWYRVGIVITFPAGVPTVQMKVNGANEGGTITTNIPAAAQGVGVKQDSNAGGTESIVHVDYIKVTQVTAKED